MCRYKYCYLFKSWHSSEHIRIWKLCKSFIAFRWEIRVQLLICGLLIQICDVYKQYQCVKS